MFFAKYVRALTGLLVLSMLVACDNIEDDLFPSGSDKRPVVQPASTGHLPGQKAADFSVSDSRGNTFSLSDHLLGGATPKDAIVLYYTMWCPICLSHTDHMISQLVPHFAGRGDIVFGVVDYVSGTITASSAAETANGYAGSALTVLVDTGQVLFNQFDAAMATTVVIGGDGTVLMNEDYRDGRHLIEALEGVLP